MLEIKMIYQVMGKRVFIFCYLNHPESFKRLPISWSCSDASQSEPALQKLWGQAPSNTGKDLRADLWLQPPQRCWEKLRRITSLLRQEEFRCRAQNTILIRDQKYTVVQNI